MKKLIIILVVFLTIQTQSFAQWQPCQGLEGGGVDYVIKSDSFLLISSIHNIYRTDTNFLSPWEKCNDIGGGRFLKVDSCIFSNGVMQYIFRSFDNGNTWNQIEDNISPLTMCSIDNIIFLDYDNRIARSDDYLDTFNFVTSLPAVDNPQVWSYDSMLIISDDFFDGIYQSVDTGSSWDTITTNGLPNGTFWANDMIYFDNTIWFGGDKGIYFLNSERTKWFEANSTLLVEEMILTLFVWDDELYCGTGKGGLYNFNQTDTAWIHVENSPKGILGLCEINDELYCGSSRGPYTMDTLGNWHTHFDGIYRRNISYLSELNDTIYTFANNDLFKSVNNGHYFDKINNVSGKQIIATDSVIYVLSGSDIIISRDNALSWDTITAGLEYRLDHLSITNDYYYVSGNGLFRSRVDSIEWIELENGLSGGPMNYFEAIDSVVIVDDNYANFVSISKDYGNTFDILFNTNDYSIPIKKINNDFYILKQNLILFSDDLGETWEEISINNPPCIAWSIDQNEDYLVVGGGYTGVLYPYLSISVDNGQTWTDLVDNLPSSDYTLIDNVKIHNERLFASSQYNSLWYRDDILTGISENNFSKEKFDKIHLYPNPVKDVITLELLSTQENCQFRIFDIRGSEQINKKIIGMKTEIYLGELKSGIYIIEVINSSEKINQKIIKY